MFSSTPHFHFCLVFLFILTSSLFSANTYVNFILYVSCRLFTLSPYSYFITSLRRTPQVITTNIHLEEAQDGGRRYTSKTILFSGFDGCFVCANLYRRLLALSPSWRRESTTGRPQLCGGWSGIFLVVGKGGCGSVSLPAKFKVNLHCLSSESQ